MIEIKTIKRKGVCRYVAAALVAGILMVSMTTGCSKDTSTQPVETQKEIAAVDTNSTTTLEKGVLVVALSPDNSDFVHYPESGVAEGFDVDLAKAIGEMTQLKVKFVFIDNKTGFADLDACLYDCAMSGIVKTEALDKVYDFSATYYTNDGNDYAIITRSGNNRLLNALNKSIALLKENGKLEEIQNKWFPSQSDTTSQDDSSQK